MLKELYNCLSSLSFSIGDTFLDHIENTIKRTNLILPEWKVVLARQRRDYGLSAQPGYGVAVGDG